jgi:hypothetical protein
VPVSVFYKKKSETAIETGAFNVWVKTSYHINTELAQGSQMRGSKEEEAEEETHCYIAIVKHAV